VHLCKILVLQIEEDKLCEITVDALAAREDYYYNKSKDILCEAVGLA